MTDLNMNNETMSTLPVTVKSHDIEGGFPNSTTSENSELCASPSSDNRFLSKEQLSVTDDEQSADDSASGSSVSSSHVFCRKRNAQQALPEEEDESSCSSCKDGPSPTALPDYCRTLRITDAHGHVRELVFPRGLDLDRPKRARTTFSTEQLDQLEREFVRNPYLVGQERTQLSHKLQLSETQVKVWFQNRRTKQKREQQRACDLRQSSAEGVAASNVLRLLQEQTPFRFAPSVSTMQKGNPFLSLPPFTT